MDAELKKVMDALRGTTPRPERITQEQDSQNTGIVTVTCDEGGQVICVSRNDAEGRILSVIWEAT